MASRCRCCGKRARMPYNLYRAVAVAEYSSVTVPLQRSRFRHSLFAPCSAAADECLRQENYSEGSSITKIVVGLIAAIQQVVCVTSCYWSVVSVYLLRFHHFLDITSISFTSCRIVSRLSAKSGHNYMQSSREIFFYINNLYSSTT